MDWERRLAEEEKEEALARQVRKAAKKQAAQDLLEYSNNEGAGIKESVEQDGEVTGVPKSADLTCLANLAAAADSQLSGLPPTLSPSSTLELNPNTKDSEFAEYFVDFQNWYHARAISKGKPVEDSSSPTGGPSELELFLAEWMKRKERS